MVIQTGQSVVTPRPPRKAALTGGQMVTASKDSVGKRNIPGQTSSDKTLHAEEARFSRKMFRICYLEKKLKKAFGRRLTNLTSNLLRYYDLPAPMRLDPVLREAYLVHRCPNHKAALASAPANARLPSNKTKTETRTVVDPRVKMADGQTAAISGLNGHQKRRHHKESCTGIKVYVSFSDLGWADWIVQPKGFVTTVCIGTCQSDDPNGYLLLNAKSKCCSPSRFKSLQVLHYNSTGSLNVTVLPDLIAVRCRCRRC